MFKSKKGQALVEFVIILPILIIIVFCLIDFGKIFYTKSDLEGTMEKVVELYKNGNTHEQISQYLVANINNAKLKITNDNNNYVDIEIIKEVDIFTPGLELVLSNPYDVSVKRVIPYE